MKYELDEPHREKWASQLKETKDSLKEQRKRDLIEKQMLRETTTS